MAKQYQAWTFPQYVRDYFRCKRSNQLVLTRSGDRYILSSPYKYMTCRAENVADARRVFRDMVLYETKSTDRRVTRHRDKV